MAITTKITLDQFLDLPETKPASEFIEGEVIQKPMPEVKHSVIVSILDFFLRLYLRQHGTVEIGPEMRCAFGPPAHESVYVPDLVVIDRKRLPDAHFYDGAFRGAPDLAIEVLSPGQDAGEFTDKILFYLEHGVRLVWVVDPRKFIVKVYRPGQGVQTLHEGDTLTGSDVLPEFTMAVDELFVNLKK